MRSPGQRLEQNRAVSGSSSRLRLPFDLTFGRSPAFTMLRPSPYAPIQNRSLNSALVLQELILPWICPS